MVSTVAHLQGDATKLSSLTHNSRQIRCVGTKTLPCSRALGGCRKAWLRRRSVREHVCPSACCPTTACVLRRLYGFKISENKETQPRFVLFPRAAPTRAARLARRCACSTCTQRYFPQASPLADWPPHRTNERARHASSGVCARVCACAANGR